MTRLLKVHWHESRELSSKIASISLGGELY
ncbi:hypothetical protein SAMN04488698_11129 [Candidatus Frackibacter sp. WG12]|nr:hypothetical protein SAMN04515661_11329 [Candidatus Frackibacter sp. WG11]SEM66312.1 hypothetical protein SAMN04488698_11129 [Candidatus Frackibacter sp. WG12]SFL77680.1 hypothetical protein SAMN04488699_11329 [Candidatus Frackibacter sp. WG13]